MIFKIYIVINLVKITQDFIFCLIYKIMLSFFLNKDNLLYVYLYMLLSFAHTNVKNTKIFNFVHWLLLYFHKLSKTQVMHGEH